MKNRLLFEKLMVAVAPAVTKYHLELQLSNKGKGESDFIMHGDTARYIAEDCSDIAKALVNEMERERSRGKEKISNATAPKEKKEEKTAGALTSEKVKSNGAHRSNGKA